MTARATQKLRPAAESPAPAEASSPIGPWATGAQAPSPAGAPTDVGKLLEHLRRMFGLSQRELAKRAGLAHGTIALIEKDKISPSVGSLRKILDSFQMSLSEFFALDAGADTKVFFGREEMIDVGGAGVSLLQVGRNLTGRPLQILLERYLPGAETAPAPYAHTGEEGGVVVSGRIELTVGNQTRILGPWESYLFPSRIPHRFRNPGPEECVIVSANSPAI